MTTTEKKYTTGHPCPDQKECGSSDAAIHRVDGSIYCFSCGNNFKGTMMENQDAQYTYQFLPQWGLSGATMERFASPTRIAEDGAPVAVEFDYPNGATQIKFLDKGRTPPYISEGPMREAGLWATDKWQAGSARAITVTEGNKDALAVFEMMGNYPVVAVKSASTAKSDCVKDRDYLNSFEKIYLCFDNDDPGQDAVKAVAALFDFNKVYHVKLTKYKDAAEYLSHGDTEAFRKTWYNSQRFLPEGIESSFALMDEAVDAAHREGTPYPFESWNHFTYGIRTGESTLITGLEGEGKSEVMRAIEAHLLEITDANIGIINLEEDKTRTYKGLAGYKLQAPVHLPDSGVSGADIKDALRKLIRRDDRLHIYSHFDSDDINVLLDAIRFMVSACNCKFIFLDHISQVVSGSESDAVEQLLTRLATKLNAMAKTLDFALIFVSHVNDEGKTRGSRYISKVAHTWIHLHRNLQALTEEEKNTTVVTFRKNRFGSKTGRTKNLVFNPETFTIRENS